MKNEEELLDNHNTDPDTRAESAVPASADSDAVPAADTAGNDADSDADDTAEMLEEVEEDAEVQLPVAPGSETARLRLGGMYRSWFLDYASYVILERAVPHIDDGLKPVQRRILHAMKVLDDGRYNKVANIVGHTMQYQSSLALSGPGLSLLHKHDMFVLQRLPFLNIVTGSPRKDRTHLIANSFPF